MDEEQLFCWQQPLTPVHTYRWKVFYLVPSTVIHFGYSRLVVDQVMWSWRKKLKILSLRILSLFLFLFSLPFHSQFIPNDPSDVENTTDYIFSHSDLLARLGRPILIMSSDKLTALQGFFVVFTGIFVLKDVSRYCL